MPRINGNFGWLKFWIKPKTCIDTEENDLSKLVDVTEKSQIKPNSNPNSGSSLTLNKDKINTLPPKISEPVSLCALPLISPSHCSTNEIGKNTEKSSLSNFFSASSEYSAFTHLPLLQKVNEIIDSYKIPIIPLKKEETLNDALVRIPKNSPHFSTLKELSKIEKMLEKSKREIEEKLLHFKYEFQDVREESSIIKDIILENKSDHLFNNLQSNLTSCSLSEKSSILERRQKLISTCAFLKKEIPQHIKWLENKLEEVENESNTAFNTVYLEFLKIQKLSLDKQAAMLNPIIRSLEYESKIPVSKGHLWQQLQKAVQTLPQKEKELACRVLPSFNSDAFVKEVCKALLTSKEEVPRPDDVSTASLLTLLKDLRTGGYLKYEAE